MKAPGIRDKAERGGKGWLPLPLREEKGSVGLVDSRGGKKGEKRGAAASENPFLKVGLRTMGRGRRFLLPSAEERKPRPPREKERLRDVSLQGE